MRLRVLRIAAGYTQERFAELAAVSSSTISSIERGIVQPSFEVIERFAQVLKKTELDLFDFRNLGNHLQQSVTARVPRKPSALIVRAKRNPAPRQQDNK